MNSAINHSYHGDGAQGLPFYKLLIRCAVFLGIFAIASIASTLVCSAIFFNTENPTSKIQLASLLALYFSVALCSIVLTRVNGEKWLLGGLILGIMIYLVTLILALFVNGEGSTENIILRALIPVISVFSAFLARRREKKHAKFKFNRRKFQA